MLEKSDRRVVRLLATGIERIHGLDLGPILMRIAFLNFQ